MVLELINLPRVAGSLDCAAGSIVRDGKVTDEGGESSGLGRGRPEASGSSVPAEHGWSDSTRCRLVASTHSHTASAVGVMFRSPRH